MGPLPADRPRDYAVVVRRCGKSSRRLDTCRPASVAGGTFPHAGAGYFHSHVFPRVFPLSSTSYSKTAQRSFRRASFFDSVL